MKSERIILSFVAILVGLVVAGVAFYFYQMTKTIAEPESQNPAISKSPPTPTPDKNLFLTVQSPKNEDVVTRGTITISGKTTADAIITIMTETSEEVVKPTKNGDFTLTQAIDDGTNVIHITAVFPSGEERRITRTVTYTTENF